MEVKPNDNSQPRVPGELDLTFATDGRIEISTQGTANSITSDKEGKLILASHVIGNQLQLSRYLADGGKDDTFEETTWNFEDDDQSTPMRVLVQEDGKILLIGDSVKAGVMRPAAMRFHPSGSPDLVFGRKIITTGPENINLSGFRYKFVDGCLQKNQKILISAAYVIAPIPPDNTSRNMCRLFCLQANGEPDEHFGEGRGFIDIRFHDRESSACNVQVQRNGSIIVAGISGYDAEQHLTRTVARYTAEGALDNTFGVGGYADVVISDEQGGESQVGELLEDNIVSRVAIQNDDKIIIAGYATGPDGLKKGLLARLGPNGSIDEHFNGGKPLLITRSSNNLAFHSMAIQPDGKIVAVGRGIMGGTTMELYERVSETGEIERFGGGHSVGDCTDVTIQPNGRIVISGSSWNPNNGTRAPRVWGRLGA